jgi:hypothetical protein
VHHGHHGNSLRRRCDWSRTTRGADRARGC